MHLITVEYSSAAAMCNVGFKKGGVKMPMIGGGVINGKRGVINSDESKGYKKKSKKIN